jgi:hypothetical protein
MLPAQIIEQLLSGDSEISNPALQEIAGERRLRCDDELRRLGPPANLPHEGAESAEIFLIGALMGPDLSNGETKHVLKVRGEMEEVRGPSLSSFTSYLSPWTSYL